MTKKTKCAALTTAAVLALLASNAWSKLPAPSDEAKAKATESAAKTAHSGKVAGYQLCMAQDSLAVQYMAEAKKAGKDVKPATATPACENPGPFSYTPATAPVPPSTPATPATPAAAPAPKI
jgi:hypothetical protein